MIAPAIAKVRAADGLTVRTLQRGNYENLKADAQLSVAIGGATACFVGTDVSYGDANWLRPIIGVEDGMVLITSVSVSSVCPSHKFSSVRARGETIAIITCFCMVSQSDVHGAILAGTSTALGESFFSQFARQPRSPSAPMLVFFLKSHARAGVHGWGLRAVSQGSSLCKQYRTSATLWVRAGSTKRESEMRLIWSDLVVSGGDGMGL